jgi:hypothetical protein
VAAPAAGGVAPTAGTRRVRIYQPPRFAMRSMMAPQLECARMERQGSMMLQDEDFSPGVADYEEAGAAGGGGMGTANFRVVKVRMNLKISKSEPGFGCLAGSEVGGFAGPGWQKTGLKADNKPQKCMVVQFTLQPTLRHFCVPIKDSNVYLQVRPGFGHAEVFAA